jgi:hypothetical protein
MKDEVSVHQKKKLKIIIIKYLQMEKIYYLKNGFLVKNF